MANTNVLLREDVDNLGGRGEIVKVKAGYARNYLLPQKIAMLATKGNVNQIELERASLLKKAAQDKSTAEAQAAQMGNIALRFERKSGDTGQLFGSVTSMDIAQALQDKGYEIDRRRVLLKDTIKETGDYKVQVRLHREVVLDIPVTVAAEGAEENSKSTKGKKAAKAVESTTDAAVETESAPELKTEGETLTS